MAVIRRSGNVFAAVVGEWVLEMKGYTKAVWQESAIAFMYYMQLPVLRGGRMPVRTGFLRASLMVSTSPISYAALNNPNENSTYVWFPTEAENMIRSAAVGSTIYFMYQAVYANRMEYGDTHIMGYGFQRLAVQAFPSIQDQVIARLG